MKLSPQVHLPPGTGLPFSCYACISLPIYRFVGIIRVVKRTLCSFCIICHYIHCTYEPKQNIRQESLSVGSVPSAQHIQITKIFTKDSRSKLIFYLTLILGFLTLTIRWLIQAYLTRHKFQVNYDVFSFNFDLDPHNFRTPTWSRYCWGWYVCQKSTSQLDQFTIYSLNTQTDRNRQTRVKLLPTCTYMRKVKNVFTVLYCS